MFGEDEVVESALESEINHIGEKVGGEASVSAEDFCTEGSEVFYFVALVPFMLHNLLFTVETVGDVRAHNQGQSLIVFVGCRIRKI